MKNFPQLLADAKPKIQEAQRVRCRINARKPTHRHIIFKLQKIKEQKKHSERMGGPAGITTKHLTYRGAMIRIISDFYSETMQAKRK